MASLKKSMRWDEEVFGLEYDLDVFNIVAVSDFNMGAMENKGLNVFNTRYVLAKPETATDTDYQGIEAVIAHEYFHNWTGNRVTCRDWFQLSLKEGLTVFRDQLFSADQGSPAVCRIGNIRTLRAAQFPEDAGPLAHPVQPQSYLRIDNFYTADGLQQGRRADPHDAHAARAPRASAAAWTSISSATTTAPRRSTTSSRAMQRRRRRRSRRFRALVPAGRHAGDHGRGPLRPGNAQLRAERRATRAADPGPARQGADADPARARPDRTRTATRCRPGSRARREARAGTRVVVADQAAPGLPLCRCRGAAGAVAAAQLLGAGQIAGRAAGPAEIPGDPRHRPGGALGCRAAGRDPRAARPGRGARAARRQMPPLDPDLVAAMRQTLADADRDPAFAAEALLLPGESILADEMAIVAVDAIHAARETARATLGQALAGTAGRDLSRAGRSRPLPHRRPLDRAARAAQCLPRLSRRRRQRGRRRGSPRRSSTPRPT